MAATTYFVTDIETDGPDPARNSMLSFATVAIDEAGKFRGEFETVLTPRPDRTTDASTMTWWSAHTEAWTAATTKPQDPAHEMQRFCDWVEGFEGLRSFAARPLMFDGVWIDRYLRDFAGRYLLDCPHWGEILFTGGALDLGSYLSGVLHRTEPHLGTTQFPEDWLGHHAHTHHAIDDARGYATVLARCLKIAAASDRHPQDFHPHRHSTA